MMTSADEERLYKAAMDQVSGSNLILDYYRRFVVKEFWFILPFFWSTMELEGTAAKMEVGKKTLK
jgi:hypothetical protein